MNSNPITGTHYYAIYTTHTNKQHSQHETDTAYRIAFITTNEEQSTQKLYNNKGFTTTNLLLTNNKIYDIDKETEEIKQNIKATDDYKHITKIAVIEQ